MLTYSKFIIAILFIVTAQFSHAAKTMRLEIEGDAFNLAELAAIIAKKDEQITVLMTHKQARPPTYEDVDLAIGDVIFMANGEKIKTVKQIEEIYKTLSIGEQLKIAVKRSGKPIMIAFNKADPDKLPKRRMVMKRGPATQGAESTTKKMKKNKQ